MSDESKYMSVRVPFDLKVALDIELADLVRRLGIRRQFSHQEWGGGLVAWYLRLPEERRNEISREILGLAKSGGVADSGTDGKGRPTRGAGGSDTTSHHKSSRPHKSAAPDRAPAPIA